MSEPIEKIVEALRERARKSRRRAGQSLIAILLIVAGGVALFVYAPRLARSTPTSSAQRMRDELNAVEARWDVATASAARARDQLALVAKTTTVPADLEAMALSDLRSQRAHFEVEYGRAARDARYSAESEQWRNLERQVFSSTRTTADLRSALGEQIGNNYSLELAIINGVAYRELDNYITARDSLERASASRASLVTALERNDGEGTVWSDIATRVSSALLIVFLVQILSGIYRHQIRLAVLYDGRADALVLIQDARLATPDAMERLSQLVPLMGSEHIDFGQAPDSIANLVVEKVSEAVKKVTPGA